MADKIRITFTGGGRIGDTVDVEMVGGCVLVGRSHSAAVRLKEADVSGRHLEIVRTAEGFRARNLSRFGSKVDGRQLSEGAEAPLKRGSVVEIGARERFRVDALSSGGGDTTTGFVVADGGAATSAGRTVATVYGGEDTVATRVGTVSIGTVSTNIAAVSNASVEESATRDAFSVVSGSVAPSAAEEAEPEGVLGIADDAATADGAPLDAPFGDADATAHSTGFVATASQGGAIDDGDDQEDGETQELRTRAGSIEEILERKRQLERNVSKKHWKFGIFVALFFVVLAGVWGLTASRRNVSDAEGPFRADGKLDCEDIDILGDSGEELSFVEYPCDSRAEIVRSADSNQIEIASFIGRDRDIPFRLFFSRSEDPSELELSLVESFEKWMTRETADAGFSFSALGTRRAEVEFWEDAFPEWMEYQTQCGVPFVRSEYTRTVGTILWRGMAYRLRSGSMVFSFRTEVPESFWRRAGYRLKTVPFVGFGGVFIDGQWDSPGKSGFASGHGEDELVALIRHELTAEGQRTWPVLEKWIDTLLAMTWGKQTPNAKSAREFNDAFLSRKTAFYNERYLAYESARLNGDEKRMRRVFEDIRDMFSMLKRERRYYKINDPEVWQWQSPR